MADVLDNSQKLGTSLDEKGRGEMQEQSTADNVERTWTEESRLQERRVLIAKRLAKLGDEIERKYRNKFRLWILELLQELLWR